MNKIILGLIFFISNSVLASPILYTCPLPQDIKVEDGDELWQLNGELTRNENGKLSKVKIYSKVAKTGVKPRPSNFNGIFVTQSSTGVYAISCDYLLFPPLSTHYVFYLGKNCQVVNKSTAQCN